MHLQVLLLQSSHHIRSHMHAHWHHTLCHPLHLQQFAEFARSILAFAAIGVPAAIVNSGLKYMQKKIELAFQVSGSVLWQARSSFPWCQWASYCLWCGVS
jgi:hypothetical protein